jgi:hypothetical protein
VEGVVRDERKSATVDEWYLDGSRMRVYSTKSKSAEGCERSNRHLPPDFQLLATSLNSQRALLLVIARAVSADPGR